MVKTLSQAEKKRLAEEKQAEKKAAMEARKEQAQQRHLAHTPPWLTNAVAQLESKKECLQTDGGVDDEIIERCEHHVQMLGELSKALEKKRLAEDALADVKDYVLDFLLEAPCEPQDLAERLAQGGDDGLYDIVSNIRKDEPTAAVLQVQEAPLPSAEKAKLPELRPAAESAAAAAAPAQEPGGRTIHTHSSYVPGLKDLCRRLEKLAEVKVVHPGAISSVSAHAEAFEMKLQRADEGVDSQKFKFAARTGHQVQDLTIVLKSGLTLDDDAVRSLVDNAMQQPRTQASSSYDALPGEGRLNQTAAEVQAQQQQHQQRKLKEKHDAKVKADAEKKRAAIKAEKKKKFQSSGATREKDFDMDAAAQYWTEQEVGERSQGRAWK